MVMCSIMMLVSRLRAQARAQCGAGAIADSLRVVQAAGRCGAVWQA